MEDLIDIRIGTQKRSFPRSRKPTFGRAPYFIINNLNILCTECFEFFWCDATVFLKDR